MQAFIDSQRAEIQRLNMSGWYATLGAAGLGEGSSGFTSMAETASVAQSPKYMRKRRRLSRLLDKLAVQISNNNHYPLPHWLMLDSPGYDPKTSEDVPLDLSIKSEVPKASKEQSGYTCDTCGQTFAVHDRLAKHVASRHRDKAPESTRAYECEICRRRFARSDMLTRHARLHSGVKPYSCSACGQVFSRSDHLATHQRTHTGEKPYRCPACPYAACRRDMITRHMRTHTRKPQATEI
ncbi:unnamed protein product [Euphydryas editha]|uniref:C2H2-type domain-containing protein n=1 Tax=Euphydryas editha TaxID=104508 RepID=A0AAU9UV32_EUPED|nr:unnamed protein product [Euphydryas editha]